MAAASSRQSAAARVAHDRPAAERTNAATDSAATDSAGVVAVVRGVLETARRRLDADLCLLARDDGDVQVVDLCVGDATSFGIGPGSPVSLAGNGTDSGRARPGAVELGNDRSAGSWPCVGVTLTRSGGARRGAVCWLNHGARPTLGNAEDDFVEVLADVVTHALFEHPEARAEPDRVRRRVRGLIDAGGPTMQFQPVFDLPSLDCMGAEALSRFPPEFGGVQQCFADAANVGLGIELELSAIEAAVRVLPEMPAEFGLGVNASPATILSGRLDGALGDAQADRLVLEVTEHDRIDDWASMRSALDPLRERGVRIAVDDVGVGYAGLQQLVQLLPEFVKMDICLTRGIDRDPARRALANALVHFAEDTSGLVVAEGIETAAELDAVVGLGVHQAQGRYLAAPGPLPLPRRANLTST